ncbi:aminoglycoside phosphotransferase family protein [Neogemmobacter tilapiae]|uniref:Aminoglycoside/hydroxyurea antibiotic resistance kinase n=1 Tax=Neogemmobacter tilapiae TaxID=875041 RepID=A0A918TUK6_9RHOB|nr:aminoglycoside phosphotransferase family protein [Gemmobacter tilapiae]GHC60709.1 aminoglycoside/hydroxyurea antibiotic resistance kinase [Gemmobacter tilapiae]
MPETACQQWGLAGLDPFAETATSRLWRAESPDHGPAVLKILKPYGADEIHGVQLMQGLAGVGMAQVFERSDDAILMEYLPGQTLSEMVRKGEDVGASRVIADVARLIRQGSTPRLVPLERYLQALFSDDPAKLPMAIRPQILAAREIGLRLLAETKATVALHGDLHHDNILQSTRGWLAIDAKGLVGNAAFEFANAFRNPHDCQELARKPIRIAAMAQVFAAELTVDPAYICAWAAVNCACSLFWSAASGNNLQDDLHLLPLLLSAANKDWGFYE